MIHVLMDNPVAQITYHKKHAVLYVEWKRESTLEEYQRVLIECLEFGRVNPIDSFIADIRRKEKVHAENRKWFEAEILPVAIKELSLKRAAAVHNGNREQKVYVEKLQNAAKRNQFTLKSFTDPHEAFKWLRSLRLKIQEFLFKP